MRRIWFVSALLSVLMLVPASSALAHGPTPGASPPAQACNGLDRAHPNIHGSGTVGEHVMHALRAGAGC